MFEFPETFSIPVGTTWPRAVEQTIRSTSVVEETALFMSCSSAAISIYLFEIYRDSRESAIKARRCRRSTATSWRRNAVNGVERDESPSLLLV